MKNFKLERETTLKTHEDEIRRLRKKMKNYNYKLLKVSTKYRERWPKHIRYEYSSRNNLEKRAIDVYSQKLDEELQKHNTLIDLEREKMEEKWTVKIENFKSTLLAEYESDKQKIINKYEQTIKEAKEEYARSLQDKECALKTHRVEKQKLFSEINKLKQNLVKIEEDTYVKIKKELDKLQFDHNLEIQKLQTANDNILKEKLANLTNENALEKSQFEEKFKTLKQAFSALTPQKQFTGCNSRASKRNKNTKGVREEKLRKT